MAIPDYQSIMLPFLKFASDKEEHSKQETVDNLSKYFKLTEQELKELLPSGRQQIFDNRVGWARTYLKKSALIKSTRRGYYVITNRGLEVLKNNPDKIDVNFLEQFPEFKEFRALKREKEEEKTSEADQTSTPEEIFETSYFKLKESLANELLQLIKSSDPALFEKTVIELLVKMGYGGSRKDAGEAIGKTGDEGIDGIIKEDKLGLDIIYVQAKRWENTVSRPEIQKFAGALQGQRAKKGIFITTSDFTKEAQEYTSKIDIKIVLIDGKTLAQLMIDNNVAVYPVSSYEIKKIDSDYFAEE
ncbi:MAG: restriction endonuclease [bacterium]